MTAATLAPDSTTRFTDLPPEIALHVFRQLLPTDSSHLLKNLRPFQKDKNARLIISLVCFRMYSGHLAISLYAEDSSCLDLTMSPQEFCQLCSDHEFSQVQPRQLDMVFVRSQRDYTRFHNMLGVLGEILDSPTTADYCKRVPHVSFMLNGNSVPGESPTLLLSVILLTLIKITTLGQTNLQLVEICSTHIGDHFPHKWGRVFGRYTLVKTLILRENRIRLDIPSAPKLLEDHFRWPPLLRVLSLARNEIVRFNGEMLKNIPKTLEELDLSENWIHAVGEPAELQFGVCEILPKLVLLNLSYNIWLELVNPAILNNAGIDETFTLNIRGCPLDETAVEALMDKAKDMNVVIVRELQR